MRGSRATPKKAAGEAAPKAAPKVGWISVGFDRIIGQKAAVRTLRKAVREDSPAQSYLFAGPTGSGKMTTALEFALALNCLEPVEGSACGKCVTCGAAARANFPDLVVWDPRTEDGKPGQNTTIKQMREMRDQANFRPLRGKWKINIIEQGDTLNEESANCILKLLEEPPEYLVNILLFKNPATVLQTIRSRCRTVRFTSVDLEELTTRLQEMTGVSPERARFLAAYSQGCPGVAISLANNDLFFEMRDTISELAEQVRSAKLWAALKLAEELRSTGGKLAKAVKEEVEEIEPSEGDSDQEPDQDKEKGEPDPGQGDAKQARKAAKDNLIRSLDILLLWYRDLLSTRVDPDAARVVNFDRMSQLKSQAAAYPDASRLMKSVDYIMHAKKAIQGNANAQIVTEALMMRLSSSAR